MEVNPKVSIILTTYNRAHLIAETLRSIQKQTFQNFECLIIDDGGQDNTATVIEPFLKDNRFLYSRRRNSYGKGLPGSRNQGLDSAVGNYICFCDDDDSMHPQQLQRCIQILANTDADFVTFEKRSFETEIPQPKIYKDIPNGRLCLTANRIHEVVSNELPLASCTVMWRKSAIRNERFNESLQYAEEWEFYIRLISEGLKGVCLDEVLYFNRKHPKSNTGEYWQKNPVRVASKKEAIRLVAQRLVEKDLMGSYLLKYLAGLAISFRDSRLLSEILTISNSTIFHRMSFHVKYTLFPLYRMFKKLKNHRFTS